MTERWKRWWWNEEEKSEKMSSEEFNLNEENYMWYHFWTMVDHFTLTMHIQTSIRKYWILPSITVAVAIAHGRRRKKDNENFYIIISDQHNNNRKMIETRDTQKRIE